MMDEVSDYYYYNLQQTVKSSPSYMFHTDDQHQQVNHFQYDNSLWISADDESIMPIDLGDSYQETLKTIEHIKKNHHVPHTSSVSQFIEYKGNFKRSWRKKDSSHRHESTTYNEARRQVHIRSEQKRRTQIKNGFEELKAFLPGNQTKKISKANLLSRTVQQLKHMQKIQDDLITEVEKLLKENAMLKQKLLLSL